jgi:hypothetical protein
MTFRQWLDHLISWLRSFPTKSDDSHCFIGRVGSSIETCLICNESCHNLDAVCSSCALYPCIEAVVCPDPDYWCDRWSAKLSKSEKRDNAIKLLDEWLSNEEVE